MGAWRLQTGVSGLGLLAGLIGLAGCDTMTPEQRSATTGAVIGAVAGQVIGGDTRGTAIGAALGGLGGYIWSRQMEDKKRQMERATAGTSTVVAQTADNSTEAGRARNRRIDIFLAERAQR
ncbi:MAG: YMGG-like glycine zipper-containing protein [Limnohabitans sp.]